MRALLLMAIMAVLCTTAPFMPQIGLYGYVWFGLMRPDYLAYSGITWYSMALAVVTLAGSIPYARNVALIAGNPICILLLTFVAVLGLSVATSHNVAYSWAEYQVYVQTVGLLFLIPLLIDDDVSLRRLLLVMGGAVGGLGVKFGLWGLMNGGARFTGGYAGFMSDNNTLALGLVMAVPLCYYSTSLVRHKWARIAWLFTTLCTVAAVIMTHSRGGALALGAVMLWIIWHSKRKILATVLLVLLTGPTVYLVQDTWLERVNTIRTPEEEASAKGRTEILKVAWVMAQDNLLTGVGFGEGNFVSLIPRYSDLDDRHVTHNTYMQILVGSGIFALGMHMVVLFGTIIWLGISARAARSVGSPWAIYPTMIQTSLIGFAVGSTFLSRLQFDFYYMEILAAACWYTVQREGVLVAEDEEDSESSDGPAPEPSFASA
jgi:putative inorganic carbon (hco3(-)) transporter